LDSISSRLRGMSGGSVYCCCCASYRAWRDVGSSAACWGSIKCCGWLCILEGLCPLPDKMGDDPCGAAFMVAAMAEAPAPLQQALLLLLLAAVVGAVFVVVAVMVGAGVLSSFMASLLRAFLQNICAVRWGLSLRKNSWYSAPISGPDDTRTKFLHITTR
jgi:hypothetical protein